MDSYLPEMRDVGGRWFQLYIFKRREVTEQLVKRAEAAGYSALCLTVDCVVGGKREANTRNRFAYPPDVRPENFAQFYEEEKAKSTITDTNFFILNLYDSAITWKDIAWLKKLQHYLLSLKELYHLWMPNLLFHMVLLPLWCPIMAEDKWTRLLLPSHAFLK